jgi:hypothetical protein
VAYVQQVHQQVLAEHRETVAGVVDAGAAVASAVERRPVTDGDRLRRPLEALLRERGLTAQLLGLLTTGADALDAEIAAEPVPGPPYLVITSRGPLCRGILTDDRRLVVELAVFAVERHRPVYRFRDPTAEECLQLSLR